MPESAPAVKVDAIAALGAEVNRVGSTYAEALVASREAAGQPGALALHAYDSFGTVAGQATLGVELGLQVPDVDTVLVAVGGGGLVSGVIRGLAGGRPAARVVAVEPEACPTLHRALAAGEPVDVQVGGVAADALGASRLGRDRARHRSRARHEVAAGRRRRDQRRPALAVASGPRGGRAGRGHGSGGAAVGCLRAGRR